MELSPSSEAAKCVATTELPSNLWNPKVNYCVHKSPLLNPILSQIIPVHTTPSCLSKIHFNIMHPPISWSLLVVSFLLASHQCPICIPLLPHSCYMPCPSHSPDLIILIILGKAYKLRSSFVWSFLQPPITPSLFSPNILLSTLFSNTLSLCFSLNVRNEDSHPYRSTGKLYYIPK
jgi:hypothetical protein